MRTSGNRGSGMTRNVPRLPDVHTISGLQSLPSPCSALGHEFLPLGQCGRAVCFVGLPVDQMAFGIEMV